MRSIFSLVVLSCVVASTTFACTASPDAAPPSVPADPDPTLPGSDAGPTGTKEGGTGDAAIGPDASGADAGAEAGPTPPTGLPTINVVPMVKGAAAASFVLSGTKVGKRQPIVEAGCGNQGSLSTTVDHPYYEVLVANPNPNAAIVDLFDTGTNAAFWYTAVYTAVSPPTTDAQLAACSRVGGPFLAGSKGGYLTGVSIAAGATVLVRVQASDSFADEPTYSTGAGVLRVETFAY